MNSSIANISIAVIHLLNKRRDGLVLINGSWGSGKTHYINNIFPKIYNPKTIFYISLLGIQSLSDFKARVIDKVYLENMEELERAVSITSNGLSVSTGNSRSAGVIDKIIKSVASSVKESVLSNLSGLFIIDDLERITNQSVLNEIIGYCHNLYTKSDEGKLDCLLVGNFTNEHQIETEHQIKIEHQEKLISDILFFEPSREDLNEIISGESYFLSHEHLTIFLNILMKYEIKNLRVVSRIIEKLKPIYLLHNDYDEGDIIISMENVIVCITCAIIAVNVYGKKINDFKTYARSYQKNKETTPEGKVVDELLAISTGYLTIKLLPYSLGLVSYTDIELIVYGKNNKLSIIEKALSYSPQIYEAEEGVIAESLFNIIIKKENPPLQEWLSAVANYQTLKEGGYLHANPIINDNEIINISETFTHEELSQHFGRIHRDIYSMFRSSSESEITSHLLKKYEKHEKENTIAKITSDIIETGWAKFNPERIDNIENMSKYKPFQTLGTKFLIQCIWKSKWTVLDITSFNKYLNDLYNFSNIADYLLGEKKHLIQIHTALEIYLGNHKNSFRFGAVLQLKRIIEGILSRL